MNPGFLSIRNVDHKVYGETEELTFSAQLGDDPWFKVKVQFDPNGFTAKLERVFERDSGPYDDFGDLTRIMFTLDNASKPADEIPYVDAARRLALGVSKKLESEV